MTRKSTRPNQGKPKLTAIEQVAVTMGTVGDMPVDERLKAMQLQVMELQLGNAILQKRDLEDRLAERERADQAEQLSLEQREGQIADEQRERKRVAKECRHRQGGPMSMPLKGRGPTALNRVEFPDGTIQIRCSICRYTVFTPHPYNQNPERRKGETAEDAAFRVKEYHRQVDAFNKLEEDLIEHSLTQESAQTMECGTSWRFADKKGNPVLVRRPCDSYALQML